jgi:hypothetical protein
MTVQQAQGLDDSLQPCQVFESRSAQSKLPMVCFLSVTSTPQLTPTSSEALVLLEAFQSSAISADANQVIQNDGKRGAAVLDENLDR